MDSRKELISHIPELGIHDIFGLIRQRKEHMDVNSKVTPFNGNIKWQENIKNEWWSTGYTGELDERQKKMIRLRETLLSCGGVEVCMPVYEEDYGDIMNHGQLWDNITRKRMPGRASKCHSNSAELWFNNRNAYKNGHAVVLCTGYALSADGLWRQHSWLIHVKPRSNVIIETTTDRVAYYGFGMTYEQAARFEEENY